jgi:acetyl-CoA synthetase
MSKYELLENVKKDSYLQGHDEYKKLYEQSIKDNDHFWAEAAKRIDWFSPFNKVKEGDFDSVNMAWYLNGKLNVSYNCLDRHLKEYATDTALIWAKDEPGEYEKITYQQVYENVCQVTNMLRHYGVKKGDRVCLYLPMIPELVYTMLACSRIGAIHSIVFAGFSSESLASRIEDAQAKIVITANEGLRGGKTIPLKKITDDALRGLDSVEKVFVVERTKTKVEMKHGRDIAYNEEIKRFRKVAPCEWMDSEDPLFMLYTSGSTGKPKGVLHTTGGYLVYASMTHQYIFDYKPGQVYFCAADIGWVTGHTYIVYGPLANRATSVLFESTPLYPDASRYWQVIDDLKVNIFYTAPTALRAVAQKGDEFVKKYKRNSLKILGTVGEPINPEIWKWYYDVVGEKKCAIVDTWWQTETGGVLITPLPGSIQPKPGSATLPFFGVKPVIVEAESGKKKEGNNVEGALCLEMSWPGQARSIFGDHDRFVQTYFTQYKGLYFTGDGCRRDEDGYYWITGRIDDVLNVSGHRLGTAEIESAIIEHQDVAEAAVVGFPHEIKGTGIYAYVILKSGVIASKNIQGEIQEKVSEVIGRFARPDTIHLTLALPKTRSGKVMRRILRKIAENIYEGLGDTSTLSEPEVVDRLIEEHKKLK